MRRCLVILSIIGLALATMAHIGSPDVFYDGVAGPYRVNVRVYPPSVVPGIAWAYVRTAEADVDSVSVRPVFWRVGEKGAPPAERAEAVRGEAGLYSQKMWLMSRGAYTVSVIVHGRRGSHAAAIPVMALATGRLDLSTPLAAILIGFGVLLFVGLVSIVRAGASDSLVEPGDIPDTASRRRGTIGSLIAVPVLLFVVFGGARWWKAEDTAYESTMYRPLGAFGEIRPASGANALRLEIRDTASLRQLSAPVMPDHGKMMHMFLVSEGDRSTFLHLHPVRDSAGAFMTGLPPIPAGRYRLFADVVLETGAEFTTTTLVDIPVSTAGRLTDPDDGYVTGAVKVAAARGARSPLGAAMLHWETSSALVAGQEVRLAFAVRDSAGRVLPVEPYLGMAGHAVVLRDDASVFIHLHPMGTMSAAAMQAFELRNRGDTTQGGRLADPHAGMTHPADRSMSGEFSFPYAFPKPGRYRIWVQVRRDGVIHTADFEAMVR